MTMFRTQSKTDYNFDEGTITEVDTVRKLCKIKTLSGQNLTNVQYVLGGPGGASRSGDRSSPVMGDRVIVNSSLGFPVIIGFLPRLQTSNNVYPQSINTGNQLVDTGSFSPGGDSTLPDTSSPPDMVQGDRIFTNVGGGMLAILRGGSLLLRSSRLAQIFISKYDDVVKVVSRNWEHFTDLHSDTIKNLGGRLYRYTGYAQNFANSHIENYLYNEYWGDVAQAETAQANYIEPGNPTPDDRIKKESVVNENGGAGVNLMTREVHLTGEVKQQVFNVPQTGYTMIDQTYGETNITAGTMNGASPPSTINPYTSSTQTPAQVTITYNGTNTETINANQINLSFEGNPTFNMNSSGIQAVMGSGEINMSSSSVVISFGSAQVTLNSAGVSCTFGGHFVNVTASGPQFG